MFFNYIFIPFIAPHRCPDGFLGTRDVLGRLHLRIGRVINVEEHVTDPDLYFFEYIEAGDRVSNAFVSIIHRCIIITPIFLHL